MKRPKQLPAVDRNSTKCASVPVGANVGPSGFWDVLGEKSPRWLCLPSWAQCSQIEWAVQAKSSPPALCRTAFTIFTLPADPDDSPTYVGKRGRVLRGGFAANGLA